MKVVLTGAAGFIGLAAAKTLATQADVLVLDSERRLARVRDNLAAVAAVPLESSQGNLDKALLGADVLVHLAWSSAPAASMANMVDDANTNIVGSLSTFAAAANAGVQKIVFASSGGTVYGNTKTIPIPEAHPTNPVSAYGVSKLAVERYLQLIAFHNGVRGISLRIGNPYGPHQFLGTPVGVIAHFIRQAINSTPLQIYGDGSIVRDYVWIDDVARAVAMAVMRDAPSGEYNIASGVGHSINQIAELVQSAMRISQAVRHVEHRSFDATKVVLDITKARDVLGWEPTLCVREGVDRMVRFALDHRPC